MRFPGQLIVKINHDTCYHFVTHVFIAWRLLSILSKQFVYAIKKNLHVANFMSINVRVIVFTLTSSQDFFAVGLRKRQEK